MLAQPLGGLSVAPRSKRHGNQSIDSFRIGDGFAPKVWQGGQLHIHDEAPELGITKAPVNAIDAVAKLSAVFTSGYLRGPFLNCRLALPRWL